MKDRIVNQIRSNETAKETLGIKPARDGNHAEVAWFVRKYLHGLNPRNFKLLMAQITPDDVCRILKDGLASGMELTWNEDETL